MSYDELIIWGQIKKNLANPQSLASSKSPKIKFSKWIFCQKSSESFSPWFIYPWNTDTAVHTGSHCLGGRKFVKTWRGMRRKEYRLSSSQCALSFDASKCRKKINHQNTKHSISTHFIEFTFCQEFLKLYFIVHICQLGRWVQAERRQIPDFTLSYLFSFHSIFSFVSRMPTLGSRHALAIQTVWL